MFIKLRERIGEYRRNYKELRKYKKVPKIRHIVEAYNN